MRRHEWYACADELRRRQRRSMLTLTIDNLGNGLSRPATLLNILDSRRGSVDSDGLTCLNHPRVENTDGLIFSIEGQLRYVSAPFIGCCAKCFLRAMGFVDRRSALELLPPEVAQIILNRELEIIANDERYDSEGYQATMSSLSDEVEAAWSTGLVLFRDLEDAFERGAAAGYAFLREQTKSTSFSSLTSAAVCANRKAKAVIDHDGSPAELYALKADCLNTIIARWLDRGHRPEVVELSLSDQLLSVLMGLEIPCLGLVGLVHPRALHLPIGRLNNDALRRIQQVDPDFAVAIAAAKTG